jgi:hypothetical protein
VANVYVRSGAAGAGTGADWTNAYTTLAAALTAKAAGDDFWVSDDHAETQASAITLTSPGTAANPCRIICVNHSGTVPPVSADLRTTATISTTGASNISAAGVAHWYGISLLAGNSSNQGRVQLNSANTGTSSYDTCVFQCNNTAAGSLIILNGTLELRSCTYTFGATGQSFNLGSNTASVLMIGGSVTGTIPTTLFNGVNGPLMVRLIGVDLSNAGSGKTLVTITGTVVSSHEFQDCKLGSSVAVTTGTITSRGGYVRLVNCDSADTNYRYAFTNLFATETQETTIVRSGGATDGVTSVSRKIVTTANPKFYYPYRSDWMLFWNTATGGALTVAIPVVTDNVTLKDNDAWIEAEGLTTSGVPLGGFVNDGAADLLNAGTNQTTDSTSSWTTTGLTTPVKQVLSTTITPQKAGFIRARVCVAKASTTLYYDPAPINANWSKYGGYQYTVGPDGMIQDVSPTIVVAHQTIHETVYN